MSRPITLASPWKDLAEKLGGVGELAKSLGGVDPTTLRRWAHGRMPNRSARVLIAGLFQQHGLRAPEFGTPRQPEQQGLQVAAADWTGMGREAMPGKKI